MTADTAPTAQRLAEPTPASVTLVSALRLRPGTEQAHRRLHAEGVLAARRLGGLVRAELIPALPEAQADTVALLTFCDRPALDRWLACDERGEVLAAMAELSEGQRTTQVASGFPGWFPTPGAAAPKRWKQALAVIAGLVPVALVVTTLRQALAPSLPLIVEVTLTSAANVAMLTWVVMPVINRLLRVWLTR